MTNETASTEARVLAAVKRTLASVIRDTATPHGMVHPLSDTTIEDLRQCLALISARERELAESEGREMRARPRFADEAKDDAKVVRIHRPARKDAPERD